MGKPTKHSSILKISQTLDSDKDRDKNCSNYPTANYFSYKKCDEEFVHSIVYSKYGFVPFWSTNNLQNVSMQRLVLGTTRPNNYTLCPSMNIFLGHPMLKMSRIVPGR